MALAAAELVRPARHEWIALRRNERHVARLAVRAPPLPSVSDDEGRLSVCAGKVYLVSGGLGSVGFAMARRLVERGATSVVLLSRRTRAEGEVGAWIEACAARGVAVQLCSVDVGDEQGMRQLVQR